MCVTLEKREIVSEVGESLFIFKDRFNTPQDRKSQKKKNVFHLVHFQFG